MELQQCQKQASEWFFTLQQQMCDAFVAIEKEAGSNAIFIPNSWQHKQNGGGTSMVMKGQVFEKVGINVSKIWGAFSEEFAKQIPGAEEDPSFWASGISVVAHMANPHVPSIHMNTRMIVTTKHWFGGGADLTPTIMYEEDNQSFHHTWEKVCNDYDPTCYLKFKKWCDEYFYLPHRKEMRGIGGIFYDYVNSGNMMHDLAFTQNIGKAFVEVFTHLVRKRMFKEYTHEEKKKQLIKRGRYAEFNLLYDRGTKFGLMTDGNVDAILMSLPPEAIWE